MKTSILNSFTNHEKNKTNELGIQIKYLEK